MNFQHLWEDGLVPVSVPANTGRLDPGKFEEMYLRGADDKAVDRKAEGRGQAPRAGTGGLSAHWAGRNSLKRRPPGLERTNPTEEAGDMEPPTLPAPSDLFQGPSFSDGPAGDR